MTTGNASAVGRLISNRPFSVCPTPLFQSKTKGKAIDILMTFNSHEKKTNFHKKSFTLSLTLKARGFATQN